MDFKHSCIADFTDDDSLECSMSNIRNVDFNISPC